MSDKEKKKGTATHAAFPPSTASQPQSMSPLLSSTPPTVTKALAQAYPYILASDKVLGLLTWTEDDQWQSFLGVAVYVTVVMYYEYLVIYCGHILAVGFIWAFVYIRQSVERRQTSEPSLDAIVHTLTNVTTKANLLLLPITSLSLTPRDVTRLAFTTLFLSPLYMFGAYFFLGPRKFLLTTGVFFLTYHSMAARVTRAVIWKSKAIRLVTFYLTGLDFSNTKRNLGAFGFTQSPLSVQSKDGKPVRFTYVLYENQRRWLGIGWTANLLAYERTPWTDEFLNEVTPPSDFKLPDTEGTGMKWQWVDQTWRLDCTNDGALVIVGNKALSTPDPSPSEGWIYYDNTWKRPTADDSFSKYTRRRRWVRTAELITVTKSSDVVVTLEEDVVTDAAGDVEIISTETEEKVRRRKGIRFEEDS